MDGSISNNGLRNNWIPIWGEDLNAGLRPIDGPVTHSLDDGNGIGIERRSGARWPDVDQGVYHKVVISIVEKCFEFIGHAVLKTGRCLGSGCPALSGVGLTVVRRPQSRN